MAGGLRSRGMAVNSSCQSYPPAEHSAEYSRAALPLVACRSESEEGTAKSTLTRPALVVRMALGQERRQGIEKAAAKGHFKFTSYSKNVGLKTHLMLSYVLQS